MRLLALVLLTALLAIPIASGSEPSRAELNKKVVSDMLHHLEDLDFAAWQKLWAEDAVEEIPLAPEGSVKRTAGKEALLKEYKVLRDVVKSLKLPIERIETLDDPSWVVVEYGVVLKFKSGREFNGAHLALAHVADGKIVRLKKYFNHALVHQAFARELKKSD